jgi:hypothetical protein
MIAMGKLNIKNGTPVGNDHLCMRCSWSQCITGYRESDRLMICNKTNPDMVVPFVVLDCTGFDDKFRPSWQQMQKLAIRIQPVRTSARTAGFSVAAEARPVVAPVKEDEVASEAAVSK